MDDTDVSLYIIPSAAAVCSTVTGTDPPSFISGAARKNLSGVTLTKYLKLRNSSQEEKNIIFVKVCV